MLRIAILIVLVCTFVGCATPSPTETIGPEYSPEYVPAAEMRATLQESLFKEDTAILSNEDFNRILAAEIKLPQSAKLAVVRFGQLPYWWGWSEDFVRTNEQIDRDFLGALEQAKTVEEVAYLPSLVTPKEMTLPHLRQAAARFQADLLLIHRTSSQTYEKMKWIGKDQTRAYCTVEAVLLETRTGIIPFSTVVTETFEAMQTSRDTDFYETIAKTQQKAVAKAWMRLAGEVVVFLDEKRPTTTPAPQQ